MKFPYTELSYIVLVIFIISIIAKFILWQKLNPKRRVGFIKSFIVWYSVHDVHNAASGHSKKFRRLNNIINLVFWACIVILITIYIFDSTGDIELFKKTNF